MGLPFIPWGKKFAPVRLDINPGRELANIGHTQRRNKVKAVARQMRADAGLPPLKALEA